MNQTNFDMSHELNGSVFAGKPLRTSKWKANPDLEKMKPELRQIEEQYVLVNRAPHLQTLNIHAFFSQFWSL